MKKVVVKKKGKEIVSVSATVEPVDYDKLAEAIVRANNKESNKYSVSREWMKFIIYPAFKYFLSNLSKLASKAVPLMREDPHR